MSAVIRCVSPRSTVAHSALVMILGSRSYGKIFSVPSSRPYTVNVMPWFRKLTSADCFRRLNSSVESPLKCSSSGS